MEAMESIETIEIGKKHLSDFQKEILNECLVKKSGGLSLTMGSGKTITSLAMASQFDNSTLIITTKASKKNFFTDKFFFNCFY
jgi:superfamily II DNA or RNA helicase